MAGERVLVVEDDRLNLELVSDLLTAAGYVVLEAEDAEAGLALARAERPAFLMDVSLPGLDGLAATRALKADPATRGIPVVVVSSHAMKGDEQKAREAGCLDYVTKPIDTRTLPGRVAAALASARGGRP